MNHVPMQIDSVVVARIKEAESQYLGLPPRLQTKQASRIIGCTGPALHKMAERIPGLLVERDGTGTRFYSRDMCADIRFMRDFLYPIDDQGGL